MIWIPFLYEKETSLALNDNTYADENWHISNFKRSV
jgi:hypothetical protein